MLLLFISLGCDKNLTNSEEMMGLLEKEGYSFTDDEDEAEIIVINTCGFILDAREESVETILRMAEHKVGNGGKCRALIVCGCLAQRHHDEMRKEIPEVDAVIGTSAYDRIADAVRDVLSGKTGIYTNDINYLPDIKTDRIISTGGHFAYLKIAEGCDKHCTYCIIPKLRGKYRSVPIENLIQEAERLAKAGVKELILVAQETTLYGVDLYGKKMLPGLLKQLDDIEGLEWIRLLYAYPEEITDELIDVIASGKKICHYIDMPIQSGSDAILKKMGRNTTVSDIKAIVGKLRTRIPDICIRTTLIAGFPGETEDDHELTMQFVSEMKFDRLGVFEYSREEETPAYDLPLQISDEYKEIRRGQIMELQQDIVFAKNEEMAGKRLQAFIEGKITGEDAYAARTYRDAPGVDGYIFINTERELMSGDIVDAVVTSAYEYDLIGEIIDL